MTCYKCLEAAVEKQTNYIADLGECIIIVRHVPSFVCPKCGEVMYAASVAKRLEQIVNAAQDSLTEIVVMSYPDHAA